MPLNERDKLKYDHYLREDERIRKWLEKDGSLLDKLVFSLSTGAIILSVTFIQAIHPNVLPRSIVLLIIAWVLLFVSITSNVLSFWFSTESAVLSHHKLNSWLKSEDYEGISLKNKWDKYVQIANIIASGLMIVGVIVLGLFMVINLTQMNMDKGKMFQSDNNSEKLAAPQISQTLTSEEMPSDSSPAESKPTPKEGKVE